jgi:hypothetical protein
VTGVRPLGRADASVAVTATAVGIGGGATASDDDGAQTWAVPWAALVLVALVLLAALRGPALVSTLRRRRARAAPGSTEPGQSPTSASATEPAPGAGVVSPGSTAFTATELQEALERARAEGRAQALAERRGPLEHRHRPDDA